MKKSMWVALNLVIAVAFVLAACGGGGQATEAQPTQAQATTVPATTAPEGPTGEVTFWHAYATGSAEEAAMAKLAEQARAAMPGLTINVLQVPFGDIFNKYRTDVAAGGGPDMFIAPNDSLGDDARAGLIADITADLEGKLEGYADLSVEGMSLDGKIYGVPESLKAVAFYYNTELLPEPPKTTDELKSMIEAKTPIAISYGCYHHWGFYNGFGGKIFDDSWKVVADQGGVADAMAYLNDLYQVAKAEGWPKNDSDSAAPFKEGTLAAVTNGNWALADYKAALGDKLAVVPLPAGPTGPASPLLGVDGYYVNPNSQNREAAVALALFLTNKDSQTLMMNEAGHVPARTDVEVTDPLLKGFQDAFQTATVRPQVPELGKYWSNFCGTDEVFEKGVAAEEWVATASTNANK